MEFTPSVVRFFATLRMTKKELAMAPPFCGYGEVRTEEELSPETGKALFSPRGKGRVPPAALFALWT